MKTEYDDPYSCNSCGKDNKVEVDPFPPWGSGETNTKCNCCGFVDSWHFGFFQSGSEGFNKSRKYSFGDDNENSCNLNC